MFRPEKKDSKDVFGPESDAVPGMAENEDTDDRIAKDLQQV